MFSHMNELIPAVPATFMPRVTYTTYAVDVDFKETLSRGDIVR